MPLPAMTDERKTLMHAFAEALLRGEAPGLTTEFRTWLCTMTANESLQCAVWMMNMFTREQLMQIQQALAVFRTGCPPVAAGDAAVN